MLRTFGFVVLTGFLNLILSANADDTGFGSPCSITRNRLQSNTHKFVSDCSDFAYCSNGTCLPRKCRRDLFPFGYSTADTLPLLCPPGSFCPDEGDGCRAQVGVGGACQLNRDEQCARGANWQDFASDENFYGSICLRSICMFANATLGSTCIIDNTTYSLGFDAESLTVVRDNCRSPQYYCDQSNMLCQQSKTLGSPCRMDQECEKRNCVVGICSEPPETPLRVTPAQYVITATCIVAATIATCLLLTLIHKRHRLKRYKELREYYQQQLRYD
ncbi:hypothetical protein GYMLUDRAFT_154772 [Collybiopsis luxurians FD-317 M1]|nr:hypothetical protein GYMLUDRAFT_154772 [Collybiopsis luxurians FD-317 M1]